MPRYPEALSKVRYYYILHIGEIEWNHFGVEDIAERGLNQRSKYNKQNKKEIKTNVFVATTHNYMQYLYYKL